MNSSHLLVIVSKSVFFTILRHPWSSQNMYLLKNISFYDELWATFQKQQFLQWIMSLLQQWCGGWLGWLAGLLGWLLPGVTQSTPPQDWLKNAQIRQFVNWILSRSGQPQFYEFIGSQPIQSFPILPNLSNPILSNPILSNPAYPIRPNPLQSYPIQPIQSCPIPSMNAQALNGLCLMPHEWPEWPSCPMPKPPCPLTAYHLQVALSVYIYIYIYTDKATWRW